MTSPNTTKAPRSNTRKPAAAAKATVEAVPVETPEESAAPAEVETPEENTKAPETGTPVDAAVLKRAVSRQEQLLQVLNARESMGLADAVVNALLKEETELVVSLLKAVQAVQTGDDES